MLKVGLLWEPIIYLNIEFIDVVLSTDAKKRKLNPFVANGVARTLKKLRTSKGDYNIKQWFSSIVSLFKVGTSLKKQ